MDYYGENLLPGQLGHFFIVLSLFASIVATLSYFLASRATAGTDGQYWKKLGRIAFITEAISVAAIFCCLFYIIYNHLFEYKYAWQHSSRELEFKYMLACFWEGQEGSFLLWSIWHCALGLVLIKTAKAWEAPVMTVISFAQVLLATMVAGIYVFGEKLGSNPFILLRDSGVLDNAPALQTGDPAHPLRQDYLKFITDGNDLNPLLQNKWMVIHPPVLFLGFASTIVPFAFALASLWNKKYGDWIRQALPWALFSAAVLGVGIMMGAWWAYESLTFGGYWAWDPVENASLVPWLILIAGIHTMLIYKSTGHSLRSTYIFIVLSFVFILYSTFLTRSGILGESSVHAFTDLGMNSQLYLLLYAFIWLSAVTAAKNRSQRLTAIGIAAALVIIAWFASSPLIAFSAMFAGVGVFIYHVQKQVPTITKEESTSSREFWMFIGSLVFFLSAIVIIGKTSLPVFNKVFGTNKAGPEDVEFAYNQIQVFVAIIVAVLTGFSQYLKYKETTSNFFWKKIGVPTIISVLLGGLVIALGNINYDKHGPMFLGAIWLATAASIYAIITNAAYIWVGVKGKLKLSGGSISHVGFGMILLGILLSSAKKEILSHNTSGIAIDFGPNAKQETGENLTLVKGMPMKMGKFDVTYIKDSLHPNPKKQKWFYEIHFKSRSDKEEFTLWPSAFVNYKGNEGLMANPDARHYFDHDIFAYVSALPNPDKNKDTASFRNKPMKEGDSVFYSKGFVILEKLVSRDSLPFEGFSPGDRATIATLKVYSANQTSYKAEPILIEKQGAFFSQPDTVMAENLVFQVSKVGDNQAEIGVKESGAVLQYVTLKAYKFPFVGVLWAGIVVTAIGIFISMARRIQLNRTGKE